MRILRGHTSGSFECHSLNDKNVNQGCSAGINSWGCQLLFLTTSVLANRFQLKLCHSFVLYDFQRKLK